MSMGLTITDKDYYTQWIEVLSARYRQSQIKAAVKVSHEMLRFYWELGRDIEEMLFSIPWSHHRCLMDRYNKEPARALFYVRKTIEEGWSRDMLLNFMEPSYEPTDHDRSKRYNK